MTSPVSLSHALIDAIDEPALVVRQQAVELANSAARALLGASIEGKDVRLAIRQPMALDAILRGQAANVEVAGIGGVGRRWSLALRPLGGDSLLLRFIDLSSLRATERMRVDFVANASHELRTPLATILGYAETLAEEDDLPDATRSAFAKSIFGEARRMVTLIEDLMSLSRIEADRFVPPSELVDPAALLAHALIQLRPLADRHAIRIESEMAPDMPPIHGDFAQLAQMIDNLVGNAVRYGCSDGADRVRLAARRDGDRLLILVSDDGPGIDPDQLPRLTERFYRVDNARSRSTGGTGLGLSIVKQIIERHRGQLNIASAPGHGTTVEVRLPFAA